MPSNLNQTSKSNTLIEQASRKTKQEVMPFRLPSNVSILGYDIYPFHQLGKGKIFNGYATLCDFIIDQKTVIIDGYGGVYWKHFQNSLQDQLSLRGFSVNWILVSDFLKGEDYIDGLVAPFLGDEEAVWGTKADLNLGDLFNLEAFTCLMANTDYNLNIVVGTGAALIDWDASVIYVDLPKNEIQHRMNAGAICNLGKTTPEEPTAMYKRFYFVDWVLLNKHKESLLGKIDAFVDAQWEDDINWAFAEDVRYALKKMSESVVRVRPWFAPGAWGGQWMKKHIPQLSQDEVNYAWSFELIVPENGIVFESDGYLLEVSFDLLMFAQAENILGKHSGKFGTEFPIRFDFLDTFDGGNLSIQCHPSLKYIQQNFGENITQDETYYILDCKDNAKVYMGFQEDIDETTFRADLEWSNETGNELSIEKYVQVHEAKKHDLFLIPNGTVHSAGADNLVLEISATPYIFTFKMYDWVRMDLNGKPRPINIAHAFHNLDFERKGELVKQELISKQYIIHQDENETCFHLPTHSQHFYDVHRHEFETETTIYTNGCCHVLMLVEGTSIQIQTADDTVMDFQFAETFIIPAAAISYRITNKGLQKAKLIKAFLK